MRKIFKITRRDGLAQIFAQIFSAKEKKNHRDCILLLRVIFANV